MITRHYPIRTVEEGELTKYYDTLSVALDQWHLSQGLTKQTDGFLKYSEQQVHLVTKLMLKYFRYHNYIVMHIYTHALLQVVLRALFQQ